MSEVNLRSSRMKVYISIPITGRRQQAREHADRVKAMLSKSGHTPVNPFEIYNGKNPAYEDYLCNDIRAMLGCDAIYFCKGWEQSCGCQIEHDVAQRMIAHGNRNFKLIYE